MFLVLFLCVALGSRRGRTVPAAGSGEMSYAREILALVPWWHWAVMGAVALGVFLLFRRKYPIWGAVAAGMTVFSGLFLLETAVVLRLCGLLPFYPGVGFRFELNWRIDTLANVVVFVPFGFFLSAWLAAAGPTGARGLGTWPRIGWATLGGFGLSLCIECLQLIFRLGYFELTDLVLNTVGTFLGAGLAAVLWAAVRIG